MGGKPSWLLFRMIQGEAPPCPTMVFLMAFNTTDYYIPLSHLQDLGVGYCLKSIPSSVVGLNGSGRVVKHLDSSLWVLQPCFPFLKTST